MVLILIFFSLYLQADENFTNKYCFKSVNESQTAANHLKSLVLPSEELILQGECLILKIRPRRQDFIHSYISKNISNSQLVFSDANEKKQSCNLKVEKIKNLKKQDTNITIATDSSLSSNVSKKTSNEVIRIQTIGDFELSVDQQQVRGECRYISKDLYEIKLSVIKTAKPIVPRELPPGSVIIMNSPPTDQETSTLSTQVQLNRGQRIELGSVIKNAHDKSQNVSITPDIKITNFEQNNSENVYLSLE